VQALKVRTPAALDFSRTPLVDVEELLLPGKGTLAAISMICLKILEIKFRTSLLLQLQ